MYNKKLYVLSVTDVEGYRMYKIGFTKNSVGKRVKQLQTGNSNEIAIEYIFEASDYISNIESRLHRDLDIYRVGGEWFELDDETFNNLPNLCDKYYNMFKALESNTYIQDRKSPL